MPPATGPESALGRWLLAVACVGVVLLLVQLQSAPPAAVPAAPPPPLRVPDRVRHLPTALPDRVVLTIPGDPATSRAVTWRTAVGARAALAQLALAGDNKRFEGKAATVRAATTPLKSDLSEAAYHSATFAGLLPKTVYAYRVGDGDNWTEWYQFRTAAREVEPFSFLYYGDAQNDIRDHWSRVVRESLRDGPRPAFLLHAGDLINHANADGEWGEWFAAGGWLNAGVPSVATPGNHEYAPLLGLSKHWRPQFALPENGPPGLGLEETVYSFDYQGVRFISLNSNTKQAEQIPWLESKLASRSGIKWVILTFHHPIYSTAMLRDSGKLRALWQPVFDKHGVDLVLTGHDHSYGRSGLLVGDTNAGTGARAQDKTGGTVYAVSVSGPKMYPLNKQAWMKSSAENTQLYQVIHIDGDRLRYEAFTATGVSHDLFELRKQADGRNRLLERDELRGN